jgi:hypothetical protein
MGELRECPFCGSSDIDLFRIGKTNQIRIECNGCRISKTQKFLRLTPEKIKGLMAEKWNTRIATPKHETVEEWESRTGGSYPLTAPVYFWDNFYVGACWSLKEYGKVNKTGLKMIVANHHGKPEIGE